MRCEFCKVELPEEFKDCPTCDPKDWMQSLKPGNKIVREIKSGDNSGKVFSYQVVKKVFKRYIECEDGTKWNDKGLLRGSDKQTKFDRILRGKDAVGILIHPCNKKYVSLKLREESQERFIKNVFNFYKWSDENSLKLTTEKMDYISSFLKKVMGDK